MADATATTAVGVAAFPFLAAIGIDPASIAAGLAGCVVVQTLLPSEQKGFAKVALMTLGSILFASLTTPFLSPIAVGYVLDHYPRAAVAPEAVKAAVAATLGGFAQPILFLIRAAIQARVAAKAKEVPDA